MIQPLLHRNNTLPNLSNAFDFLFRNGKVGFSFEHYTLHSSLIIINIGASTLVLCQSLTFLLQTTFVLFENLFSFLFLCPSPFFPYQISIHFTTGQETQPGEEGKSQHKNGGLLQVIR